MMTILRVTKRMRTTAEDCTGKPRQSPGKRPCERNEYQGQGLVGVYLAVTLIATGCMSSHRNRARAGGQGPITVADMTAPSSPVILRDGTSLTLRLVSELSSETAKVGDTVEFVTAYPLRVQGLVAIPKGVPVSGTVVEVSHRHRPAKNGEVRVKVEKLSLTDARTAPLRLSKSRSAGGKQILQSSHDSKWIWLAAPLDPITAGLAATIMPFVKGQEVVYPKGTLALVYFDGEITFDRDALWASQPAPYKGQPQVFFSDADQSYSGHAVLFCDDARLDFSRPLRVELTAGTHTLSIGMGWDQPDGKADLNRQREAMQVNFAEDHQYWIERYVAGHWPAYRTRLRVRDLPQNQLEFDIVQNDLTWESATCSPTKPEVNR